MSSLMKKYVLWKGFYHDFSTKKASASGAWPQTKGLCSPGPRRGRGGTAPWTTKVPLPPLTIYPGAAPGYII